MNEIKFKTESYFLGRNGMCKCNGLNISQTFSVGIIIEPITSKNQIGRSAISIPKDSIQELIDTLKTFL